jgi:hypothetical protein
VSEAPVAAGLPAWQRAYVVATIALSGAVLAACAASFGSWPRLIYAPYDRAWVLASEPPAGATAAMVFMGIVAWAVAAGVVVGATTHVGLRWRTRPLPLGTLRVVGAWALTACALCGSYFVWMIWPA